jgi:single-strand DNA-binding protein
MSLFGDLNEVRLLGNMTQDVELRYTANGTAVANFSVATNRRYKQNEEWKDAVEFHNIVVWGNLAQNVAQRSKKGTRILVTGRLQTRSWEGQDGQKRYKTEVVADDVFLIDRFERGKSEDLEAPKVSEGNIEDDLIDKESKNLDQKSAKKSKKDKDKKDNPPTKQSDDIVDPDDLPF